MDYSTESITQLAQQMAAAFKAAVAHHCEMGSKALTIADVETGMRQRLRQIGLQSLRLYLSTTGGTPAAELPCACGSQVHYQRHRPAIITSVFGPLTYERAYYAGCAGKGKLRWMRITGSN